MSNQKKWILFGIIGTYSYGTCLTLKVGLVPVETTRVTNTIAVVTITICRTIGSSNSLDYERGSISSK